MGRQQCGKKDGGQRAADERGGCLGSVKKRRTVFRKSVPTRNCCCGDKDDFARCLTGKLLAYATGREMGFSDRREIDRIVEEVTGRGYGLRNLLEEVVTSSIFRSR